MALVTLQRSPSPSNDPEEESAEGGEDGSEGRASLRHKRSKSTLQRLRKIFSTVRFISKLRPCLSESYFTIKGAALILAQSDVTRKTSRKNHGGEIQRHLQSMLYLLRPEDKIKVAIRLEGLREGEHRYMALVSTLGRQDTEESVILGLDCSAVASAISSPPGSPRTPRTPTSPTASTSLTSPISEAASAASSSISTHAMSARIGLVLPIWMGMKVRLSGDGGFSILLDEKSYLFKPVSVQAMWSAIQSLNKALHQAEQMKYLAEGLSHTWVQYYHSKVDTSDRSRLTTWNLMEDVEVFAPASLDFKGENENEKLKMKISAKLKEVMMSVDLDEATSLSLRKEVEAALDMKLDQYRSYFDEEMIRILGQMDAPSEILPFLYLGSEWNASNLEELQKLEIKYILNVTREIDNFFTGMFHYYNIRLYDQEDSELLKHWPKTHRFINKARKHGSKVLVHCKMGISRSASTVMAYLMKENQWPLEKAFSFVKERRSCVRPNKGFMEQLHTYEGILHASSKRNVFRSVSEQNILEEGGEEGSENMQQGTFLGDSLFQQMSHSDWPNQDLTPEEEILLRKGYNGDYDHTAMEPDFETDSRSADSMEEPLPDMPSPMSEDPGGFDLASQDGAAASDADSKPTGTLKVTSEKNTQSGEMLKVLPDLHIGVGDSHSASRIKPDSSWIRLETPGESSTDPPVQQPMDVGGSDDPGHGAEFFIGAENTQTQKTETETCAPEEEMAAPLSPPPKIVIEGAGETADWSTDRSRQDDVEMGVHQYYSREQIPWSPGKVRNLREGFCNLKSSSATSDLSAKSDTRAETGDDERGMESEAALLEAVGNLQTAPVMTLCDSCMELSALDIEMDEGADDGGRPRSVYELEDIPLTPGTVRRTRQEIEERQRLYGDEYDQGIFGLKSPVQRSSSLREERSSSRSRSSERRRTCTPIVSPPPERATESLEELAATPVLNLGSRIGESSTDDLEREMEVGESDATAGEESQNVTVYTFGQETVPVESGVVRRHKAEIESKGQELHQRTLSTGSSGSLTSCDSCEPTAHWSPPHAPPTSTFFASDNAHSQDAPHGAFHSVPASRNLWPSVVHREHSETPLAAKHKNATAVRTSAPSPVHHGFMESSLASRQEDGCSSARPRSVSDRSEWMKTGEGVVWERPSGASFGKGVATKTEDSCGAKQQSVTQGESKASGAEAAQGAESHSFVSRMESRRDGSAVPGSESEADKPSKEDSGSGMSTSPRADSGKSTPRQPGKKHPGKSNIDPQTLAMIREIGSAFISTPAKTEDEDSAGSGTSLVKHLVKNIERQQKVPKAERKIVIIDSSSNTSSKRNGAQGKRRTQDVEMSELPRPSSSSQHSTSPGSHTMWPSEEETRKPSSQHEQAHSGQHSPDCHEERSRPSGDSASFPVAAASRVGDQQPSVVRHLRGRFETQSPQSDTSDGEQSLSGNSESSASAASAPAAFSHHGDVVCDIPVVLEEKEDIPVTGPSSKITKTKSLDDYSPRMRSESQPSSGRPGHAPSHLSQQSRRPRSAEHIMPQIYPPGVRHGIRQPWQREGSEGGEEGESKVRKLHGKSHPLTRLQPSTQR